METRPCAVCSNLHAGNGRSGERAEEQWMVRKAADVSEVRMVPKANVVRCALCCMRGVCQTRMRSCGDCLAATATHLFEASGGGGGRVLSGHLPILQYTVWILI